MDPLDLLQVAALEGPQVGDGAVGGADDTSGTDRPDTSLQLASEERAKRLEKKNESPLKPTHEKFPCATLYALILVKHLKTCFFVSTPKKAKKN